MKFRDYPILTFLLVIAFLVGLIVAVMNGCIGDGNVQ